jgi:hypothetical protein
MEITRRSYLVDLFTATHKIEGVFQPVGDILISLNNAEQAYVPLSEATFTPLDPESPLRPASVPQVVVSKEDLIFACLRDEDVVEEIRMLRRVERIIVYTAAFALRGEFHLGVEQRIPDMLDTMRGHLQPITDVTVFPLIQTKVAIPRKQRLVLLNTHAVQMYHPETTS